jgi:hypothetical protein
MVWSHEASCHGKPDTRLGKHALLLTPALSPFSKEVVSLLVKTMIPTHSLSSQEILIFKNLFA